MFGLSHRAFPGMSFFSPGYVVFVDVYVTYLRLNAIASNGRLGPLVKTLTFDDLFLDCMVVSPNSFIRRLAFVKEYNDILTPDGRVKKLFPRLCSRFTFDHDFRESAIPKGLKSLGWNRQRVFDLWTAHRKMATEQHEMIHKSLDVERLAAALSGFPNLEKVLFAAYGTTIEKKVSPDVQEHLIFMDQRKRNDARQLEIFFRAVATSAEPPKRLSTLFIDEDFFTYEDSDADSFDFGDIPTKHIKAASPRLIGLRHLEFPLSATCLPNNWNDDEAREINAAALVAGLPVLEDLIIRNDGSPTIRASKILDAISSPAVDIIDMEHCLLDVPSLDRFCIAHPTIRGIRLSETKLLFKGSAEKIFGCIRGLPILSHFIIDGYIVEVDSNQTEYFPQEESEDQYDELLERRDKAREALSSFALRTLDEWPATLLDVTPQNSSFPEGITLIIGESCIAEQEDDYDMNHTQLSELTMLRLLYSSQ